MDVSLTKMSNGPITVPNFAVMEVSTSTTSVAMLYSIRGEIKPWKPKMPLSKKLCNKPTPYEFWLAHKKDKRSHYKRVTKGLKKWTDYSYISDIYVKDMGDYDAEVDLLRDAYFNQGEEEAEFDEAINELHIAATQGLFPA